jgi:hypothetical protein
MAGSNQVPHEMPAHRADAAEGNAGHAVVASLFS